MTMFAANGNARTFDYQAGDVGYVTVSTNVVIDTIRTVFTSSELSIGKQRSLH